MADTHFAWRRYNRTIEFLRSSNDPPRRILDLGERNPLSPLLESEGYEVVNTRGDLDEEQPDLATIEVDAVTAFEILEHLVSPMTVLRVAPGRRLFATVPLRLWFATAYRNPTDPWDRHYHEFEDWQFDWLLEKSGWKIIRREKWTSPTPLIGLRPLLRRFTPRYYAVEAVRDKDTSQAG